MKFLLKMLASKKALSMAKDAYRKYQQKNNRR